MDLHSARAQNSGFVVIYCTVFILIALKAFTLPITHDEAWTVLSYTKHDVWDIMMYPDAWPNNHILNSILAKWSMSLFGAHDWSVRLPNVLFFGVFTWGVFRFLKSIFTERSHWFLPAALLFVVSPYFLDFFSLCRGYGISSALTMLSVSFFVTGFKNQKDKHIWWAVITAVFASYANFTVLVYWAAASCVAALYFLQFRTSWKQCLLKWSVLLVAGIGYLALIALPIYKMKSTDQFVYWPSNGFYKDTVFSVVNASLSDSGVFTRPDWISKLVVLLALMLGAIVGWMLYKGKFKRDSFKNPLVVTGTVLFATVGINLLQTAILNDPNLNGRTALFLVPIFIAFVVASFPLLLSGKWRVWSQVGAVLTVLIVIQHLSTTIRMNSFKEWRYDAHTFEVMDLIQPENGGEVTLATNWLFNNSFHFYTKYEGYPWLKLVPYDSEIHPDSDADYYYVTIDQVEQMEVNYEVVKTFNGEVLMKRKIAN